MEIRDYLKEKRLIMDGAFGTYFVLKGGSGIPESANTENPKLVQSIHEAYIRAGAKMIRSNTFSSNLAAFQDDEKALRENIKAGIQIAKMAAGISNEDIFIAGDIGPVAWSMERDRRKLEKSYELQCECFVENEIRILLFETFPDLEGIESVIRRIKEKYPALFMMVHFCLNQHGYTETGVSAKRLLQKIQENPDIDAAGFNCGVGPGHLSKIMSQLNLSIGKYISALPNASYPQEIRHRMVFMENMDYFVEKQKEIADLGVQILGGCCGTTPNYIEKMKKEVPETLGQLSKGEEKSHMLPKRQEERETFLTKKKPGEKIIAVELAPPPNADDEKIMDSANLLKSCDVDIVTFPDSPSGRTRADSILMAVKVAKEVNITVMPHICCRDKNTIAIRSQLLGAHINGIENLLVMTGDPVPASARTEIKSVFNFDSIGLMRVLQEMNREQFRNHVMVYGGALNYNRLNPEVELDRMKRKIQAGAQFFMTQPLFGKEDVEKLRFIKSRVDTRIICGIMPLISLKNALFMKNEMAGIDVPEEVLMRFRPDMTRSEGEQVGVALAKEIMALTEDFVDGYYFSIPFNRVYLLKEIQNHKGKE